MPTAMKITAGVVLALLLALPGGLYLLGMAGVEGRPEPLEVPASGRDACGDLPPAAMAPLDPWRFAWALAAVPMPQWQAPHAQAYWVARHYLIGQLRPSNGEQQLAVAALTVWITRHWNAQQIADTARHLDYCRGL